MSDPTGTPLGGGSSAGDKVPVATVLPEDLEKLRVALEQRFEVALMEQEHRFIPSVLNFARTLFAPRNDPRRWAALKALLWRFFSASTAVGAGVSIVAILTLLVAIRANRLLEMQNEKIDLQNHLIEGQRRSALIFEVTSILEQLDREKTAAGWDKMREDQRLVAYRTRTGKRPDTQKAAFPLTPGLVGRIQALSRSLRPYRYLAVSPADVSIGLQWRLAHMAASRRTESNNRGWLFDRMPHWLFDLMPWATTQEDSSGRLTERPLSPERGQLLITLVGAQVDMRPILKGADFSDANLTGAVLAEADLRGAILARANLVDSALVDVDLSEAVLIEADLTKADLTGSQLNGAKLMDAKLGDAFLTGADMTGADLSEAEVRNADMSQAILIGTTVTGTEIKEAHLHGAIVSARTWLDTIHLRSWPGIENKMWRVAEETTPFGRRQYVVRPSTAVSSPQTQKPGMLKCNEVLSRRSDLANAVREQEVFVGSVVGRSMECAGTVWMFVAGLDPTRTALEIKISDRDVVTVFFLRGTGPLRLEQGEKMMITGVAAGWDKKCR